MGRENVGLFDSRRFELSRNFLKQWLQRKLVARSVAWQSQATSAKEDYEDVSLNKNQKSFERIFCSAIWNFYLFVPCFQLKYVRGNCSLDSID